MLSYLDRMVVRETGAAHIAHMDDLTQKATRKPDPEINPPFV